MEEHEGDIAPAVPSDAGRTEEHVEEQVEQATEAVEQATEAVANDVPGAEARLEEAERRLEALETTLAELRSGIEGRAPAEHTHPLPSHLQTVADALNEIEREETAPERKVGFWHRKLW